MSRLAPLEPPYAPEIQQQFDRIMRGAPPLLLFRTIAGQPRAWEKFRAGSLLDRGPLSLARARDRHRPHLRADRMRIRMGRPCRDLRRRGPSHRRAGPRHRAGRSHRPLLVGRRAGADRGGRCAASARHARATPNSRRCRRITTRRRFSRSSCCAASIAPCRIWRTGWRCRWRRTRQGFRRADRHSGATRSVEPQMCNCTSGISSSGFALRTDPE